MTDEGARDPLIGSLFNNYRIDALLAQGGMGAVYLLRDATLPNIRKVLKVILPEFANNASIRERFLREAEAVSMLRHPNVVGIDAIGSLPDGRLCMVIPFLEGKPLDEFLAEHGGRLAPHRVMHIVAHIARALDYVHRKGIIHRDLKPGNVFVEPTEDDRYFSKVLDFGIAKQLNARTKRASPTLSAPTGTPCYMSVEQYVSPGDVTPAADVFALAVMVWQMVTGCLPWGQHDPGLMYQKQLQEPPERPVGSWLSPEWEALLREALSPDPRLRPQSVRQFVQALASRLPAIEPLFPSGVEILTRVARNLLTNSAHDDETVRNPSDRPPSPAWPVHETPLPNGRAPQSAAPAQADAASPISASPVTVNLRPASAAAEPALAAPSANAIASPPTTLGSATGTIEPSARVPRRRKRALLGLAAAGSVGVAAIALVATRSGSGVTPAAETVRHPTENPAPSEVQSVPTKGTNAARGPEVGIGVGADSATAAPTGATPPTATPASARSGSSAPSPALDRSPATSKASPPPAANHPAMVAHPATPRAGASPSPEPSRPKPAAVPVKAIPDRTSVEPAKTGSAKHPVERDEIGGQKED
jgi:serine/threonine-protein kinase